MSRQQIACLVGKTLYLLVVSADNLCKQFGSRSGSKLFDTLMVFLKEFFEKADFEKYQQTKKKHTWVTLGTFNFCEFSISCLISFNLASLIATLVTALMASCKKGPKLKNRHFFPFEKLQLFFLIYLCQTYSKISLKPPLKNRQNKDLNDKW